MTRFKHESLREIAKKENLLLLSKFKEKQTVRLTFILLNFTWYTVWLQKGRALRRIYFSSLIWPNILHEWSFPGWQVLENFDSIITN